MLETKIRIIDQAFKTKLKILFFKQPFAEGERTLRTGHLVLEFFQTENPFLFTNHHGHRVFIKELPRGHPVSHQQRTFIAQKSIKRRGSEPDFLLKSPRALTSLPYIADCISSFVRHLGPLHVVLLASFLPMSLLQLALLPCSIPHFIRTGVPTAEV